MDTLHSHVERIDFSGQLVIIQDYAFALALALAFDYMYNVC